MVTKLPSQKENKTYILVPRKIQTVILVSERQWARSSDRFLEP
jgi:hypothetical protein